LGIFGDIFTFEDMGTKIISKNEKSVGVQDDGIIFYKNFKRLRNFCGIGFFDDMSTNTG
jgi:hypothetical protein